MTAFFFPPPYCRVTEHFIPSVVGVAELLARRHPFFPDPQGHFRPHQVRACYHPRSGGNVREFLEVDPQIVILVWYFVFLNVAMYLYYFGILVCWHFHSFFWYFDVLYVYTYLCFDAFVVFVFLCLRCAVLLYTSSWRCPCQATLITPKNSLGVCFRTPARLRVYTYVELT